MRSRVAILLAALMTIMVAPAAMATTIFTILDKTNVEEFTYSTPSGIWTDVIGESVFQTTEIDVIYAGSDVEFKILTHFTAATEPISGIGDVRIADLALDLGSNGSWDRAILLFAYPGGFSAGLWDVAANTNWSTSADLWSSTGDTYGGKYDDVSDTLHSFSQNPLTQMKTGTFDQSFSAESVTSGQLIDVTLHGVNGGGSWDNLSFFWGTGTCSNDGIAGTVSGGGDNNTVPEPATILLIGAGLIGIVGFAKKFKK